MYTPTPQEAQQFWIVFKVSKISDMVFYEKKYFEAYINIFHKKIILCNYIYMKVIRAMFEYMTLMFTAF